MSTPAAQSKPPSVFHALKPYKLLIAGLVVLSMAGNGLTLWLPKVIAHAIDSFARDGVKTSEIILQFGSLTGAILVMAYIQSVIQTVTSERVARNIRARLADRISRQSYAYVQRNDPSRLLTNLTSDIDSIKSFVAQAVVSLISSVVLIVGTSIPLISIDWRLGLAVLTVVPFMMAVFYLTLKRVRAIFIQARQVIDRLNRVINESILGAAFIRVVNSREYENRKFGHANAEARKLGIGLIGNFARLIPTVVLLANAASLIIVLLGGHYVMEGSLSLGEYAAFSSYLAILIFPILVIGFISGLIAQANVSYGRIVEVLNAPDVPESGSYDQPVRGEVAVDNVTLSFGDKKVLDGVSFTAAAGSRTAIIGPTAAGKSQLLYVLTGLTPPDFGAVSIDGIDVHDFTRDALHNQVGFVFQDSIIFNLSLRENIAFSRDVSPEALSKAITVAELDGLVQSLPEGLDTVISERGTSLSGGQKQRVMLARALALAPRILLLDDFTARVDTVTETKIITNLRRQYPSMTLISVTQKVNAVHDYDRIVLLMEGEVLATGTHAELLENSPEYMQIYNSQRSTTEYDMKPVMP